MIPFNKPFLCGNEIEYIINANKLGQLSGDGFYTLKCKEWLQNNTGCDLALLTHSCTAALEMAAILLDLKEGDEIIMPSYTFVSTANAFVLRGAKPVFIDIDMETLNMNVELIEGNITSRTKAIVPVHYAGVGCDMDKILKISEEYNLKIIEDAAQGISASYKNSVLGGIGDLGCYSFHETKNIFCGEGGALLINNPEYIERAEIIREKGTNRSQFSRGTVDKYTWVDLGSSFLPGELNAAFLFAQMEKADEIKKKRIEIWVYYQQILEYLVEEGFISTPNIPFECNHNGHIFYIIHKSTEQRQLFIKKMKDRGIMCVFHYVPLHSSPFAKKHFGINKSLQLPYTDEISSRITRIPLWIGVDKEFVGINMKEVLEEIRLLY